MAAAVSKRKPRPHRRPSLDQFFSRIDPDLHKRFKGFCEEQGRTKSKQFERMLTEYLEAHGW